MIDQTKNIMIGLFVIAACSIVIFILLFLHPSVGDEALKLRVRFSDIDKVNLGTRVSYGGKAVGEVVEIREIPEASEGRKGHNGQVYLYELELRVDSNVNVYNSDEVLLRTSGLLGERSIAIVPEAPRPGQELKLMNNEVIYASQTGSVEETFKEFKEVADRFDVALDAITEFFREINKEKVPKAIADSLHNIADITAQMKSGKSTIGKLLYDDDLYLRFTSIMNKGEVVMDDINHYGVLFHLDKGWQRLRARRMNLLQKLSTPQEFQNYFNDEVDQISTSLSRVSMILNETNSCPMYQCLMANPEFTKVYSNLLRRVTAMEESLKMYNQQLVETEVRKTELNPCMMRDPCQ